MKVNTPYHFPMSRPSTGVQERREWLRGLSVPCNSCLYPPQESAELSPVENDRQPVCHALPQHRTIRPNADRLGRHIYTFMTGQGLRCEEDNSTEERERIIRRTVGF
ncbi:hypothetical protein J4Q44_G00339470 [Coregonus suidteri]|uniref:Uncharacterized protein n=1 Tax=Coregonus suidteri TaxID=861788 RepID=A0AAN8KVT2_9TELE